MSTGQIFKIRLESSSDTEAFARKLGEQLKGGEVIELIGDVGAGKTTFVRGLAKGLGSKDHVSSPTFTVYKVYNGRMPLYHYDFYRLGDDLVIRNELAELTTNKQAVIVLEWADKVQAVLPREHIKITIKTIDENTRQFDVALPTRMHHISL